jgi:hypothetical protein
MNVLQGKPLHMATTPASEATIETEISKFNSYMSPQGDSGHGELYPCLAGLL